MTSPQAQVRRDKTAIHRFRNSKPVGLALAHGLIAPERSVLDYGCGRGEDVKYLQSMGIEGSGWDPHYRPDAEVAEADIVNLGYVLNVIENPVERAETLVRAHALARHALIVAVRVDHSLETGTEFSDGLLTSRGSFQKIYKQSEFKVYLEQILGQRPHMAYLGIAYLFKDANLQAQYLASLVQPRLLASATSCLEQFSHDPTASEYLKLAAQLGRPPLRLNSISIQRSLKSLVLLCGSRISQGGYCHREPSMKLSLAGGRTFSPTLP